MAEAAAVTDEAGSRLPGSRRSQREYRRRRQRHCATVATASVGTTDDHVHENIEHRSVPDDEQNDRMLHRRGAVRERRRRYADLNGTMPPPDRLPRLPVFEENLMMGEPMMLDRIDGLNDAWDAGRFVAVLRQRRDLLFGVTEHDLINALIGDDGIGGIADRVEHVFPVGEARFMECFVCLELKNLHLRVCCGLAACDDCLRNYLSTQVGQGVIKIQCIGASCTVIMHRDEILARLSGADKARYAQFLLEANCDPLQRTCPRCSHVLMVDLHVLSSADKFGLMVTCAECHLDWCFPCHAPWHADMKCADFRRGDKLLKAWAREQHFGQVNAQKCPKCKFYIQRSSGCDHMTCSRCKTDFCYRCGERFRELKFVGNHYSKLSIFGCKYRFKPTQPVQRRLIRGSIFAAQLMAVPALGALALGAGAIVASVGSLVLPFYAGYKLHKRLERRRSAKRRRQAREAMWRKLEDMRWRGEELDISHPMLDEMDTSQMIRSYIGLELAGVDGNASTSDDAASVLNSELNYSELNSEFDVSSSTDDDLSLHIRDEAVQTGDDLAAEPCLLDGLRMVRDEPIAVSTCGVPLTGDDGISAWRTMLHAGDSYDYGDGSFIRPQVLDYSAHDNQPKDVGRDLFQDDVDLALDKEVSRSGEVHNPQDYEFKSPGPLTRCTSDSSLDVSASTEVSPKCRKLSNMCITSLSVGSALATKPVEDAAGSPGRQMCHSVSDGPKMKHPAIVMIDGKPSGSQNLDAIENSCIGRDIATTELALPANEDSEAPLPLAVDEVEDCVSTGVQEAFTVSSLALDPLALPEDAFRDTDQSLGLSRDTCYHPISTIVGKRRSGVESVDVMKECGTCSGHPAAGMSCMDHEVCGLLADFVTHL